MSVIPDTDRESHLFILSLRESLFRDRGNLVSRLCLPPTLQNLRLENSLLRRENLSGLRAELKDFSLNMKFLANYVQSDDFCFFSSRKRRKMSLVKSI